MNLTNESGATVDLFTQDPSTIGDPATTNEDDSSGAADGAAGNGVDMEVTNTTPLPCATGPPSGGQPVIVTNARPDSKRQKPPKNEPGLKIEDGYKYARPTI